MAQDHGSNHQAAAERHRLVWSYDNTVKSKVDVHCQSFRGGLATCGRQWPNTSTRLQLFGAGSDLRPAASTLPMAAGSAQRIWVDTNQAPTSDVTREECLRLWAGRDQVGLICMLRLSQEKFVDRRRCRYKLLHRGIS
eukprot:s2191_g10.t4